MSIRRRKFQAPPPPSPRILHLPRRTIKLRTITKPQTPSRLAGKPPSDHREPEPPCRSRRGKLETLFDQERAFSRTVPLILLSSGESERRERVDPSRRSCNVDDSNEEKWRFQAEIMRAECNLLRMEREVAEKRLEKNRSEISKTLHAAVETLASGKKRILDGEISGIFLQTTLQKQISDLQAKLEDLLRNSRENELRKCSNFDKQTSLLQRRLVKLGSSSQEQCVKEIREMAEASLSIHSSCRSESSILDNRNCSSDIDILRKKMEILSKGMIESRRAAERIEEEYISMITSTTTSSASSSSRRIDFPDMPKEQRVNQEKACSEHCKAIVRKIVEHVQAETEQWSQMQGMLHQVREEMEELQTSRDFWEDRALEADDRVQTLQVAMHEWRQKALSSESKISDLQKQISVLRNEIDRSSSRLTDRSSSDLVVSRTTDSGKIKVLDGSRYTQKEEKRILICRLKEKSEKENRSSPPASTAKRPPLREIGNSSPFSRHGRVVFPLSCTEELSKSDCFEK